MAESKKKELKKAEVIAETVSVEESTETSKEVTKSGKRSAKAVKETEEKQAKEERKLAKPKETDKPKQVKRTARSKAERAGKKYRKALKLIDKEKSYNLAEAMELAAKTSPTNFDATVEVHINLGVDPKQADQNVRGTVVLPSGTGQAVRVAVFDEDETTAKAAGADVVGVEKILAELEKETINFDVLIASPNQMSKLAKFARLLGPRGLMPSPKSGTVTQNIAQAVKETKSGKVEYRVDQAGIIHAPIGKVSFGAEKLMANAEAIISSVRSAKPASLKGNYINSIYLTTTMGPSIKVST